MSPLVVTSSEGRTAASPVRVRLVDTFTLRPPTGPTTVELERRGATRWAPMAHPHQVSTAGELRFVGLGRSARDGDPLEIRLRVSVRGTISETAAGDEWVTGSVPTWRPDAPPGVVVTDVVHLFPGPAYAFPAGVPLVAGRVVLADGAAAGRAQVLCRTTVRGRVVTEEVRADAGGWFRLALRWSAGTATVEAALGALSATRTVPLPGGLTATHLLTLS